MPTALAIVMPVLDEAGAIVATLEALAPWRRQGVRVIVVDGGSRDATVALCAGRVDTVLASAPGRARQMNTGASAAGQAQALLFLHADTRLPADALPAVLAALAPGAAQWGRFDVHISGRSALLPLIGWMMNWRSRLTGIATGDQAIFVQRTAFEAVGGYADQPLMEDIELSKRLRRLGAAACLRQRVVTSGRRWDSRGPWRTVLLMWRLRWLYWLGRPAEELARAYR